MPRYANVDKLMEHAIIMDWLVLKWVNEVDISTAINPNVVEVKHGYFIGTEFDGYADGYPVFYEWKCSECGCIFEDEEPTYNYCPQCGAKMDGEETEDGQNDVNTQ